MKQLLLLALGLMGSAHIHASGSHPFSKNPFKEEVAEASDEDDELTYSIDLADLYSVTISYELFRDEHYNQPLWNEVINQSATLIQSIPDHEKFFTNLSTLSKSIFVKVGREEGIFGGISIIPSAQSYYPQRSHIPLASPALSATVRTVQLNLIITRSEDSDADSWATMFNHIKTIIEQIGASETTKEQKLELIANTTREMFSLANTTPGFAGLVVIGASMEPSENLEYITQEDEQESA